MLGLLTLLEMFEVRREFEFPNQLGDKGRLL
jgi:hypothetical protein